MSTLESAYDNRILKRLGDAALQNVEATTIYVLFYGAALIVSGRLSIDLKLVVPWGDRGADSALWRVGINSLVRTFCQEENDHAATGDQHIYLGDEDSQARSPRSSFPQRSSVSFFILCKSEPRSEPPSRSYENLWWSRPICRCRKGRG